MNKYFVLGLGLFININVYASLPDKCASMAAALTGNEYGLKVSNGDLIATSSRFSNYSSSDKETVVYQNGKKIVFIKMGGKIIRIEDGNRRHNLDGDCNLVQTYEVHARRDKFIPSSLLYDKDLCGEIGKIYRSLGMSKAQAAKCDQLSEKVQNLINTKNHTATVGDDRIPLTFDRERNFTALDYVTRCAYQSDFERRLDGKHTEAERFSKEWFRSVLTPSTTTRSNSTAGSGAR